MSQDIQVRFPVKGIDESVAYSGQPPATTREAVNVASIDPVSGRIRGGQRSGLSKYVSDPVQAGVKISDIASVAYDNPAIEYTPEPTKLAETDWTKSLPGRGSAFVVRVDELNNVYVAEEGAALTKLNSDGEKIWSVNVPVADKLHQIKALDVDGTQYVFCAVTEGGSQSNAKLFAYQQVDGEPPALIYEEPVGMFVSDVVLDGDNLYLACNDVDKNTSEIRVYGSIRTSGAEFLKSWTVPYPVNGLAKSSKDSNLYSTHPKNDSRNVNQQGSGSTGTSIDWTPKLLPNWSKRAWCWLDATDLDGDESYNSDYENNEEVLVWFDKTGNNRNLYRNIDASTTSVTEYSGKLLKKSVAGRDAVSFNGTDQSMMSAGSASTAADLRNSPLRSQNLSIVPANTDCKFAMFMVFRAPVESVMRVVWGQDKTTSHAYDNFKGLTVNRHPAAGDSGTSWCGTMPAGAPASLSSVQPGSVCYSVRGGDAAASGHGSPNGRPASGSSPSDYCVVTIIQDTKYGAYSSWRLNGRPMDSWVTLLTSQGAGDPTSTAPVYLGWNPGTFASNAGRFKGLMCEMIVLSDWAQSSGNPFEASTEGNFLNYSKGVDGTPYPLRGHSSEKAWPNQYSTEVSGSTYTDEVELIEGYLAHKWGCAHILAIGRQASLYVDCGGTATPPAVSVGSSMSVDNRWAGVDQQRTYNFVAAATADNEIDVSPAISNYAALEAVRSKINGTTTANLSIAFAPPLAFCIERSGAARQYMAVMNLLTKSNVNSEVHQVGTNFTVPALGWQWILDSRVVPGTEFQLSNSMSFTSTSMDYTSQAGYDLTYLAQDMYCTAFDGTNTFNAYVVSVAGPVVTTTQWIRASDGASVTPGSGSYVKIESVTWMDLARTAVVSGASALMDGGLYSGAFAVPHKHYLYSPYKQYTLEPSDTGLSFGPNIVLDRQTLGGPPRSDMKSLLSDYEVYATKKSALCKWNRDSGSLKWSLYSGKHGDSTVTFGGVGYGITTSSGGKVLTIGAREDGTFVTSSPNRTQANGSYLQGGNVADLQTIRITTDNGDTYGSSVACPLPQAVGSDPDYGYFKPGADEFGNFYVPYFEYSQLNIASLMIYKETGALRHSYGLKDSSGLQYNGMGYAAAPSRVNPKFQDGFENKIAEHVFLGSRVENIAFIDWTGTNPVNGDTVTIKVGQNTAETLTFSTTNFLYPSIQIQALNPAQTWAGFISGINRYSPYASAKYKEEQVFPSVDDNALILARSPVPNGNANSTVTLTLGPTAPFVVSAGSVKDETLSKIRLLETAPVAESFRTMATIAIAGPALFKIDPQDGVTAVGGTGFETATSGYHSSCSMLQKIYVTNGDKILVYNPKTNTSEKLKATNAGEAPKRCKLLAAWRGRLVAARSADNPHNWYMSAVGEPENWNYFPATITATQAISGTISRAGLAPDIINAIVPYSDDLLMFGGDHSIYRLTGDPMAGGQMDLVTDVSGMAFGQSWDKDANGGLYYLSSRGVLYAMMPGKRGVQDVSGAKFTTRLSRIDFSKYATKLLWNDAEQTLHIFLLPYGPGGEVVTHYRWERDTQAFWEDEFAYATGGSSATDRQPTAVAVVDGDQPADRAVLLGCEDGYVRRWDGAAFDDDGQAIDSRVVLGPFAQSAAELRLSMIQAVLAKEQAGAGVQIYASDVPDKMGSLVWSGQLRAGRNPNIFARAKGSYFWIRIRSSFAGRRWAFESMVLKVAQTGRSRVRP